MAMRHRCCHMCLQHGLGRTPGLSGESGGSCCLRSPSFVQSIPRSLNVPLVPGELWAVHTQHLVAKDIGVDHAQGTAHASCPLQGRSWNFHLPS